MKLLNEAKKVLKIEAEAILSAMKTLGQEFSKAVSIIQTSKGKVVVIGVGKSGLVGRKLSATLSSIGRASCFMHAGEALLGDLGMVVKGDVVLALSFSGETEEILEIIPYLKKLRIKLISMSGRKDSSLARASDACIYTGIKKEADSCDIIPTASSTLMLAMGDALAVCLMLKKGFKKNDLAMTHPNGTIGKRLIMKVGDIMRAGSDNPVIGENKKVRDALFVMTDTHLGAVSVVNSRGKLVGFFTDGDLRRKLQKDEKLLSRKIREVMTVNPQTLVRDMLAVEALVLMKKKGFDNIPVVNAANCPVGIVDERDLISEGISE